MKNNWKNPFAVFGIFLLCIWVFFVIITAMIYISFILTYYVFMSLVTDNTKYYRESFNKALDDFKYVGDLK